MTSYDFAISGQHYLFDVQSFAHTILAAGGDAFSYALLDRTTQGVIDDVASGAAELGVIMQTSETESALNEALAEAGVVSPLRRAGMTKANVRHVLASLEERFGLPSGALMSAKPSFPRLAVYVPQGESIPEASLREAARSRGL